MIERIIENVRILGKKPALLLRTTTTVDDVVLYENLFWSPEERSNFMERYSALKTSRDGKECRRYALSTKNRVAFIRALVSLWASNDHNASIIPIEALFRTSFSKLPATENERLILFTSGTTGISKGVVHSNSSLDHQIKFLVKTWNWCERDKLLISLPLSHVHGLVTGVLSALSVGASVHIQDRFSPASTSSILGSDLIDNADSGITIYTAVPTMYHQILSNLNMQKDHSSLNFDKLRLFACGSAPVSKDLSRRWLETLGKPLTARYGTTETGIVISQPLFTDSTIFSHKIENSVQYSEKVDFNDNSKVSSSLKYNASPIGKPIDKAVNISIKDGEMYIKSPTIGSHYLVSNNFQNSLSSSFESLEFTIPNSSLARNNDDFNDLILFPDPKFTPEIYTMPVTDDKGWFRTGDLVTTCEDGSLFFTGRKCDLINVAGNKVAPLTVETIIHHELSIHISDCAVVPLNCPIYGQKVALLYCTHNKQPIEGLKRILLRLLPTSFHVPSDIRLVDKIPRNFMGKIDRIEAAKRFESI